MWAAGASVLAVTSLLLAGCTPAGSTSNTSEGTSGHFTKAEIAKAMNTPTTITFWAWDVGENKLVARFEKKYPKIKVDLVNAGQSLAEYTKLTTVLKAGSGIPDVAEFEYEYIPQFQNDLADLNDYGAASLKSEYVPSAWKQGETADGAVAVLPNNQAPVGNLYRSDLFKSTGIAEPKTWSGYATAAKELKKKTGDYITDLAGNDAEQFCALLWQAGARPFAYNGGKQVTIDLTNSLDKKVANYWNTLIQEGVVANQPDFTNDWFSALASGKYAGWLVGSWGAAFLEGDVAGTSGDWAAAPLPQWDSASPASSFYGGDSQAVMKTTKHPIASYEFVKFLNNDGPTNLYKATSQSLFPTATATLANPEFINEPSSFFGGQQVNKTFAQIAKTVSGSWQWLPFNTVVFSDFESTVGTAIANKTSLVAGLSAWQSDLVTYARQQGYTVKTN